MNHTRINLTTLRSVPLFAMLLCQSTLFASTDPLWSRNIGNGDQLQVTPVAEGASGVVLQRDRGVPMSAAHPVIIEILSQGDTRRVARAYTNIRGYEGGFVGTVVVDDFLDHGCSFRVVDKWQVTDDGKIRIDRKVTVSGEADGGYFSGITLHAPERLERDQVKMFAPGMIYGSTNHITKQAIGGKHVYRDGQGHTWIREDRLPAPLFGLMFADGSSIAMLNTDPDGTTNLADAMDDDLKPLVDAQFRFGSMGARLHDGRLETGYFFPGSEGEVTYQANTYPDGQLQAWRMRYHPIADGHTQNYAIEISLGDSQSFTEFYRSAWRWAWNRLQPDIAYHDIEEVRTSLLNMLANNVIRVEDRAGVPLYLSSAYGVRARNNLVFMGFTGKNIEVANFFLKESLLAEGPRSQRMRRHGQDIIDSFTRIGMSPPEGDSFDIHTGEPTVPPRRPGMLYLRTLGDGFKSLMQAILREKEHGRQHPEWTAWAIEFGDWLLDQQHDDGAFPRAWRPGTGEITDESTHSSYNPVPFLVHLYQHTGNTTYLESAKRAAEYTWNRSQREGKYFIGGTIDNPDVIDKEGGTLSLEAFMRLYEATGESKWLDRSRVAADFSETWIYIWNIPMPVDADDDDLHWKHGVPTTGLQLISTGHSLVDQYMAFEVDEFARLYRYTGDPHYKEVARLLLHNTKTMLGLPGRTFDLKGPGWQQEHWSLAPYRGVGIHRGWLPWVSTSHLKGIFGLMDFDSELYQELSREPTTEK